MKHNTDAIKTHCFRQKNLPLPDGFVTLESLKVNLDTGLIGDKLNSLKYRYGYADLQALAGANVDTSINELISWLNNNRHSAPYFINQVAAEFNYKDDDPLLNLLQIAQYEFYCDDLEKHFDDVIAFYTLNQLIDTGIYAIRKDIDLFDLIRINLFDDINNGVNNFNDKLHNLIENAFIENENIDSSTARNMTKKCIGSDFYLVNPYVLTVRTTKLINDKGYDRAFIQDWSYFLEDKSDDM